MQVIEADPDDLFIEQIIRDLTTQSLEAVATSAEVQRRFQPILEQHLETLEAVRRKATCANAVVHFDLVDEGYEGFNRFIPYYLFPETTYSVALTRHCGRRSRWDRILGAEARTHNIAKICERYGGGGHAVVGAVSFKPEEVEEARTACGKLLLNSRLKTRIYRAINSSILPPASALWRQNAWTIVRAKHVVLDAHANPQILLRDVLSISRDIDPRLDGHHHTRLERTRFLIEVVPPNVMNVDADHVTKPVHVKLLVLILLDQLLRFTLQQPELDHTFSQHFDRMLL